MGLGKTVITLTAISDMMEELEVYRVLVIAPLRVAEDTWSRESEKWDHLKYLEISKILGSAKEREAALKAKADIYVINRENVVWLCEYLAKNKIRWPFDCMVIDELSSFKSSQAKRFKALRKQLPFINRVIGLTGTPAANSLMDLWAEMYLLDRGARLGGSISAYRQQYFKPGYGNGYVVYQYKPKPGAEKFIAKRIADITMSMRAEDYLSLPDLIESVISVRMDPDAQKIYDTIERDAVLSLEEGEVTAMSAAAVMSKLLQIANGFVYDDKHGEHSVHKAKLEALQELIEAADSPVLVFYSFQADKELILREVKGSRLLESDKDITDWNKGKVKVLLAHPGSAGYGLNLQEGGHIMVWYGLPWSLEQYQQATARLHRQGQKYPVMVYHILTEGTVDGQVQKSLVKKDMTQSALIGLLKDRKRRYR
jgi:SNF2 family DNA or RNA helicase